MSNPSSPMPQKKIVVFMQSDLGVGGIENYIYRQIRMLCKRNVPVVWISDKHSYIAPAYEEELKNSPLVIWKNKIHQEELYRMTDGSPDAHIVFVSSYLNWFVMAERFRTEYHWCRMDNFFLVNHFTGWMNYLETAYPKWMQESVRKKLGKIFSKMNVNGCIRYFSKSHIGVMQENYGYQAVGETSVPSAYTSTKFDYNRCRELYQRKTFNILSVTRFDFPHKGYLLGLVQVYGKLKNKYKSLTLTIVGYGPDESHLLEEINKLPESAKADITLHGAVSPDKLVTFYNNATVNVSTAGSCSTGARNGTLSLPARNYCTQCEVYGYFPDAKNKVTSSDEGLPVEDFLEEILNMTESEYVQKCKDSYDTYNNASNNIAKIEDIRNTTAAPALNKSDIQYSKRIFGVVMCKTRMKGYTHAIQDKGFFNILKSRFKRIFRRKK